MATIDLNADLGEGFGSWRLGDDEGMLGIVSSANVACGFHAGDASTMLRTARLAAERGVAIGAHVGYRDLAGFGRRALDIASDDLAAETTYQIGALRAIAAAAGTRVSYVKPHGALYNAIVRDERQAAAVVDGIVAAGGGLAILGLPGSAVLRLAAAAGLATVAEAFADRAYRADGSLVPRSQPGSVLSDAGLVAERMLRLVETGEIEAIDGLVVRSRPDSICVHGDSPGAVALAAAVRARLDGAGVRVAPFAASP